MGDLLWKRCRAGDDLLGTSWGGWRGSGFTAALRLCRLEPSTEARERARLSPLISLPCSLYVAAGEVSTSSTESESAVAEQGRSYGEGSAAKAGW